MKDFERYSKEFYLSTKNILLKDVIKSYQLPNSKDLHSMICGYKCLDEFEDTKLYDKAESIDYFEYEKELWNLEKPN